MPQYSRFVIISRKAVVVFFLWITALSASPSPAAADPGSGGGRIMVELSRLLVYDTIPLGGGESAVYPLEAAPSGLKKLRVTTGRATGVSALLLDRDNYLLFKEQGSYSPLPAKAETIRNMRFLFFEIPREGSYYLVLRSEGRKTPRDVSVYASGLFEQMPAEKQELQHTYQDFYATMSRLIAFPDFAITVGGCGEENAFSSPDIFICDEFLANLPAKGLQDYALWVAFHELGHNLLKAWGDPRWNDEDAADEFGAYLISITPYRRALLQAVERLLKEGPWQAERLKDSRKRLLLERAQRTVGWLSSPESLSAGWADVLGPHLKTTGTSAGSSEGSSRPRSSHGTGR